MTTTTPTQKSIKFLESKGFLVGKVEQQIPHTFIKRDLFGIFDLVALGNGYSDDERITETVGIQVTTAANMAARVKKIQDSPAIAAIREAGWRIMVHGWKQDKDGKWTVKEVDIS